MKKTISLFLTLVIVLSVIAAAPLEVYAGRNWIYVDENIEHGSVIVKNNLNNAIQDPARIRMTAVPDEGYDLKGWNVHYRNGAEIPVEKDTGTYEYYFDLPQTNSKDKWIVIGAVFEQDVPHHVYVSWDDQSGMGSSLRIDKPDGVYVPGETVTVTVDVRQGATLYRRALEASYYRDDNNNVVYLEDFPDYTQIDEYTFSFTMPKYDVNLSALFLEAISTVTADKFFVEAGKTSGEMTDTEMAQYPCYDPTIFIWNEATNRWDLESLPFEVYAGQRVNVVTNNADSFQYCVTGITVLYEKDGETVEQDIVHPETDVNERRELSAEFTTVGLDMTIRCKVERLFFVNCAASEHGEIRPSISRALPGETVKLNTVKDQNYGCASLTVTDGSGNNVPLSADNSFVMPETNVTVSAVFKTGYVDCAWNGEEVVSTVRPIPENKLVQISAVSNNTLSAGNWYVVSGTQTFDSRLRVSGTANIMLCDGATLNANKGIEVGQSATLNIYAQEAGTGKLYASPEHNTSHASIGADSGNAGEINIYGGVITADTESHSRGAGIGGGENGAAGVIRIYAGEISANTLNGGAAIGGGKNGQASWHSGEGIIIYGGKINAEGTGSGAGIGNGSHADYSVGSIAIYGGEITAEGRGSSAAIGGGYESRNGRIDIYGGEISASADGSNQTGAAIGSGTAHQGSEINIHGGAVVAVSKSGAGIGAGYGRNGGVINISGGAVWANSSEGGAGIGGGCNGNGGTVNISGGVVYATSALFEYSPNAIKSVLNVIKPIKPYQNNYSAYGQAGGALVLVGVAAIVDLIGSSDKSGAAIGGGDDGSGGSVHITGGVVMAKTSLDGANAIGHGNDDDNSGELQIYNTAKVTAGSDANEVNCTLQPKANRIAACRSNMYVLIEPCSWHYGKYTDTGDAGHKQVCTYCYAENEAISAHVYRKTGVCMFCNHQAHLLKVKKVWPEGAVLPSSVTVKVTSTYVEDVQNCETDEITLTLTADNDWTAEIPAIPGAHKLVFTERTVRNFLPESWTLSDGEQSVVLPADEDAGVGSCVLDLINEDNAVPDDEYARYLDILSSEERTLILTNEPAKRIAVRIAWPEGASESKIPESVNVHYSFGINSGTAVLKRSGSWTSYIQIPADEEDTLSLTLDGIEYFLPVAWTLTGGEQSVNVTDYSDRSHADIEVGSGSSAEICAALEAGDAAVTLSVADSSNLPGVYSVLPDGGVQGGVVTRSRDTAYAGDVITLTAEPDHNFAFVSFAVTDEDGQTVPVSGNTFEMPASDVTVSALFVRIAYSITIHWSSVDGQDLMAPIVIDGIALGTNVRDALADAGYTGSRLPFEKAGYDDFCDNLLQEPITAYTSEYEMQRAALDCFTTPEEDVILYYPMLKTIDAVTITVTPPICGTTTSTAYPDAPWTDQTNPPALTVPDGVPYQLDTTDDTLPAWWIVGATGKTYIGSFAGGRAYQFSVCLAHDFGYTFDKNEEITVNGGRLYRRSYPEQFVCEVVAVHEESAEGIVTREPTVSEPGERTYYCVGCDLVMRTEPILFEIRDYQSVTIDDQIAINLLLNLDARGVGTDVVAITLNGKAYETEGTKVSGGVYDGLYKFKLVMAPAQIADKIIVTIEGDANPIETSVKDYCIQLLDDQYTADYADAQALAGAILAYGQAANDAFGYSADTIADISGLNPAAAQNAAAVFSDTTGQVTGASFMALTKPEFRFYTADVDEQTAYDYNQAGVSATMDGGSDVLNARFVKKEDGSILLEVTGISAENMDKTVTVNITNLGTITFNGNAFAKAMAMNSNNTTQQNLGASLYNYGAAAKICFGA